MHVRFGIVVGLIIVGAFGCKKGDESSADNGGSEGGGGFTPTGTGGAPPDACVGVTCSGHGTCVADGLSASCECDDGYHGSGTACVSDEAVFGMDIPVDHPRLVFNSTNLESARARYASIGSGSRDEDAVAEALRGLLEEDAASCASAVEWAITTSEDMRVSGTACDDCRWFGEDVILTYDWCYDMMSDSDRTALEDSIDNWVDHWRTESWGGVPMHQNNYYWGYLRNELEWGIVRYDSNPELAMVLLDDAFNVRLADDFYPAPGVVGGVGQEGAQYGPYLLGYMVVPLISAALMGRDMFGENPYYLAGMYAYIYETTPNFSEVFTWNDNDGYSPSRASNGFIVNYMAAAARNWASTPAGGHAKRWLDEVDSEPSLYFQVIDDSDVSAGDLSALPRDYYAPGPSYLFGRSDWSTSATAYMLILGAEDGVGHSHRDFGSFQINRGGSWLSRESVGYGSSDVNVVGLGGDGSDDVSTAVAHNTVAVGTALPGRGEPVVNRLESQPEYSFANVDLSDTFDGPHVERDFVFVRGLETLVVYDRGADVFLSHCETTPTTSGGQATCTVDSDQLVVTSLVGSPSVSVVTEGGRSGQERIEISTSGNEMITVLQALDAGGTAFTPEVVDDGGSYIVSLGPSVEIEFVQGGSSSGGSITIDGTTTQLRTDVQEIAVTPSGPVWAE